MLYSKDHVREINYSEKQIERKMLEYMKWFNSCLSLYLSGFIDGIVYADAYYRGAVLVYTFIDLCETLFHSLGGTKLATKRLRMASNKELHFSLSLHFPARHTRAHTDSHTSATAPVKFTQTKRVIEKENDTKKIVLPGMNKKKKHSRFAWVRRTW